VNNWVSNCSVIGYSTRLPLCGPALKVRQSMR
jgi:hypothetical protein